MRRTDTSPVLWHVGPDGAIPDDVAAAAARGLPIVAHLGRDASIDALAAELLEECAAVVRYPT
ncbi:MAG: hypothetical protein M3389_04855 [Actinomycetota bacterium]|nr:hypothetical protein [Actinomycetota bacterium]